jgi:hypothetical protein
MPTSRTEMNDTRSPPFRRPCSNVEWCYIKRNVALGAISIASVNMQKCTGTQSPRGDSAGATHSPPILLLPTQLTYEQVMAVVSRFKGKVERRQPKDQTRQWR